MYAVELVVADGSERWPNGLDRWRGVVYDWLDGEYVRGEVVSAHYFREARAWCENHWQDSQAIQCPKPVWVATRQVDERLHSPSGRLWVVGRPVFEDGDLEFSASEYDENGALTNQTVSSDKAKVMEWAERRWREDLDRRDA